MGFSGNGYSTASTVITSEGDLRIGNSSGQAERLAIGSSGKVLESDGSTASWETISTADSVLTTHGDVLYEGASALARLGQSTDNYTLATKGSGANPAWQASSTSVLTGTADILYSSGANTLARLAVGTSRQVLQTNTATNAVEWVTSPQKLMGGTGEMLYASAPNVLANLAVGADGTTMQMASGVPAWVSVAAGGGDTTIVMKESDQTVSNSTTYVDATDIVVTLDADSFYFFDLTLMVTRASSTGYDSSFKWQFEGDGISPKFIASPNGFGSFSNLQSTMELGNMTLDNNSNKIGRYYGSLEIDGSERTLKLQFAQNVAGAANITLNKGTSLVVYKANQ